MKVVAFLAYGFLHCSDICRAPYMSLLIFGTPCLDNISDVRTLVLHLCIVAHDDIEETVKKGVRGWYSCRVGTGSAEMWQKGGNGTARQAMQLVRLDGEISSLIGMQMRVTVRYVIVVSRHSSWIGVSAIRYPWKLCRATTPPCRFEPGPSAASMHHCSGHGCFSGTGFSCVVEPFTRHRAGWRRSCLKSVRFQQP